MGASFVMVYLWGAALFIFLLTVPKQETKEEKVWTELEESVVKKKKDVPSKRHKLGDVDWDKVNGHH